MIDLIINEPKVAFILLLPLCFALILLIVIILQYKKGKAKKGTFKEACFNLFIKDIHKKLGFISQKKSK